uniref:ROK family protein n=1 Tax=uncultured Amnibacterium sp. TaxID=1631851 RepID=UPI0035CBD118
VHLRHDFDAVAAAAMRGEPVCRAAIERSADLLAVAVLSVVNLLDLDRIHLAGPGFAAAGELYLRAIRDAVARAARSRDVHAVVVELSDPEFDAAAVGAASLALQHVLTPHTRPAPAAREPATA